MKIKKIKKKGFDELWVQKNEKLLQVNFIAQLVEREVFLLQENLDNREKQVI